MPYKNCPECEFGVLRERTNRKTGEVFWACNKYPGCKFTAEFNEITDEQDEYINKLLEENKELKRKLSTKPEPVKASAAMADALLRDAVYDWHPDRNQDSDTLSRRTVVAKLNEIRSKLR